MASKSLLEAIREKYGEDEASFDHIFVARRPQTAKSQSADIIVPKQLSVEKYGITSCGDKSELAAICSEVTELDLMDNHIQEWAEVQSILQCMPSIHFLHLAGNPLGTSTSVLTSDGLEGNQVTRLVCNKTHISWQCVGNLLRIFTKLQELHLSLNDFTSVDLGSTDPCPGIQQVYLNQNAISDWEHIGRLGRVFPNMTQLVLIGNPVEYIDCDQPLSHLEVLNLSQTKLRDWTEIEKLRKYPKLTAVRLLEVPFLEEFPPEERRALTVAYLPNISQLNGSPVEVGEREKAERAFIRKYMDSEVKPDRYHELEALHGRLEPLVDIDMTPPVQVQVLVVFDDHKQLQTLSTKITIQEMKRIISKFLGHPSSKLRFFHYKGYYYEGGPTDLCVPSKLLYSLPLESGDTITVHRKFGYNG